MGVRTVLAMSALAVALVGQARAADTGRDLFGKPLAADSLAAERGGTDAGMTVSDSVLQSNTTSQTPTNNGGVSLSGDAVKLSGTIYSATVAGNRGLTTVMQNTGDLVNLSNATSVNVYLR